MSAAARIEMLEQLVRDGDEEAQEHLAREYRRQGLLEFFARLRVLELLPQRSMEEQQEIAASAAHSD